MRARSIKPGLFKNESLGAADPLYTVIFEGLWCIADREGRLEDRPLRIHVEVNPYRDSAGTVQALDWLVQHGFVTRYESGGAKYLEIVNFRKHQQPHIKEAPSKIPAPQNQGDVVAPDKHGASTEVAALTPSSLTLDSGLLTAGNAREAGNVPRRTITARPELSDDFEDFVMANCPNTAHRKNWPSAFAGARAIVGSGKATEADLRRRWLGFLEFVNTRGYSDPSKVPSPQSWFAYQQQGEAYWSKEWAAVPTKAQQMQEANVSAGLEWLARGSANA